MILSRETGSRTIIFDPGSQNPLTVTEFSKVDFDIFSWIHFEARPYVKEMIKHLRSLNHVSQTELSQNLKKITISMHQ